MKNLKNNFVIKFILNTLAVIYIIFDEVFISLSNIINSFVEKYQIFDKLNQQLKSLNKYVLLFILIIILGISEVFGILSFVELSKGNFYLFLILYIMKFIPFFIVSYIFKQTKDILLSISWFNYCYIKVCFVTDYLKHLPFVLKIKELKDEYKIIVKEKAKLFYKKYIKDLL